MPKEKSTKTLKEVCLLNIAKHMETVWCADYKKNFLDQGKFLFVLGPFDALPTGLVQQLIDLLSECKWMKPYYLHLLIDERLEHLDLSGCRNIANKDTIVSLIAARCRRLRSLKLATLNQVPPRLLQDLVAAIPMVTILNLKQTKCDDQVLTKIGNVCKNLRDLNVSGCPITDMGVMSLCVSFDQQVKKCERLLRLDLTNTVVTAKGVQCALESLPHLQFLFYPDICEILYRMFATKKGVEGDTLVLPLRYLSIQQMKATLAPITPSIEVSCHHCPHITEVHFLRGVGNAGVLALTTLSQLHTLHLANCDEELITFEGGILPLLQAIGSGLGELSLNEINKLDIGCIAVCCTNLKKFQCLIAGYDMAEFLVHSHPEMLSATGGKGFRKLEHISILLHTAHNNFPESYLKLLTVNSPKMKFINLACINALSDEIFEQILKENPMNQLESLKLESCSQITGEAIWKVLLAENQLSLLNLMHCFEINRSDFQEYQRYCKDKNYEISIDWL